MKIHPIFSSALAMAFAAILCSCGGGGGGSASSQTQSSAPYVPVSASGLEQNQAIAYVDRGPASAAGNIPNAIFVDLKICKPGSSTSCSTVDHVLVDTGSVGLRLMASALPSQLLALLPQKTATDGNPAAECLPFVSGTTWGAVREADLFIGGPSGDGKSVSGLPIQIIADPGAQFSPIPSACSNQGSPMQTPSALGANGILGIGLFAQDCGSSCSASALKIYFSCPSSGTCVPIAMPIQNQIPNPISKFASDNNGSVLSMPAVATPSSRVDGVLSFGIGTRANNSMAGNSQQVQTNSNGYFKAIFNGQALLSSFIDSGSSVNFFPASGSTPYPACSGGISGFFCPSSTIEQTALLGASSSAQALVRTANARSLFTAYPSSYAFPNLAGPIGAPYVSLDLGASFFFGRSVATLIESAPAAGFPFMGPAFGFTP